MSGAAPINDPPVSAEDAEDLGGRSRSVWFMDGARQALAGPMLVVSVSGYMYGLDAATGRQLWYNPMKGFGIGVTALVSVNGMSSNPMTAAAAEQAAQQSSQTSTTPT